MKNIAKFSQTHFYFVFIFILTFILTSCGQKSENSSDGLAANTSNYKRSTECELPQVLSKECNQYEPGTNATYEDINKYVSNFLKEIKEKTSFPLLRRYDMLCFEGNSEVLVPSDEVIKSVIQLVKNHHDEEVAEMEQVLENVEPQSEEFYSNGKLQSQYFDTEDKNGNRFEKRLSFNKSGDTTYYYLFGGPSSTKSEKILIGDSPEIKYSYDRASAYIKFNPKSGHVYFSIVNQTIFSKILGENREDGISLHTIPEYNRSYTLRTSVDNILIYEQDFERSKTFFENGNMIYEQYKEGKTVKKAILNYKTPRLLSYLLVRDSMLTIKDFILDFKAVKDGRVFIFKKEIIIDKGFEYGKFIYEYDFSSGYKITYNRDGSVSGKEKIPDNILNGNLGNVWSSAWVGYAGR